MKTIVIASTKGGVGKTTLTTTLATEAAGGAKKVGVVDVDPMQSTARWFELRDEGRGPVLVTDATSVAEAATALAADGWDYLFVDTPPGPLSAVIAAVKSADLVVIPCRPSPIDVEASDLIVELVRKEGKPFVFIVNAVPERSDLVAGALEFLRCKGEVLEPVVMFSERHPEAMIEGRTAREKGNESGAGDDLKLLWREIKRRVESSSAKRRGG